MKIALLIALSSISILNTVAACDLKVSFEVWKPYQTKIGNKYSGLDVEITEAIAKEAGCKITIFEQPWIRQLAENESGQVDVTMGASKTPEREIFAHFTEGYRNETNSLFVKKGVGADIKTIADLATTKAKIGVARGTSYGAEIDAIISKLDASADNDTMNVKKAMAGRIDGFLVDHYTGVALIKEQNASDKILVHPLAISSSEVYLMVGKKSKIPNLTNKLDEALKKIKADGTYAKIIAKYTW